MFLNIGTAKTNKREIKTSRSNLKQSLQKWPKGQGNKAKVVFQTGLTGSTGCVLSYASQGVRVVWKSSNVRFRYDERRYIYVTEFAAQSNRSIHRKVREERKAQPQKSLNSEEIIRAGTRITQIGRIYTDYHIPRDKQRTGTN